MMTKPVDKAVGKRRREIRLKELWDRLAWFGGPEALVDWINANLDPEEIFSHADLRLEWVHKTSKKCLCCEKNFDDCMPESIFSDIKLELWALRNGFVRRPGAE